MGYLADFDTGFANSRGAISPKAATVADMLAAAGYGTYALGKWHLTPPSQMSPAGPFVNWPTQRGFDRFYGFLGGGTSPMDPTYDFPDGPKKMQGYGGDLGQGRVADGVDALLDLLDRRGQVCVQGDALAR